MYVKFIRIDRALNDTFSEAEGRGNKYKITIARFSVAREHHAAGTEVASYHSLNSGRKRDIRVGKTLVNTVGNGTVIEKRSEHAAYSINHGVGATNIQECLLLSGK